MISTNKASIGRYEILGEIGRGAMGVVYKARDPQLDRIVAIKTISLFDLEPSDEQEYRERFQQEARTAGRLSHPGIVAIFDVGSDPETKAPYIVMEHVAGNSLTKILTEDNGKIPLATALQIVEEVAEALHYAHSEGVTHRDVKPANILLTPDGKAKLADFGIARLDQSHLTLPGRLLGSPAYMAPEQMRGEATDGRSDLFSLGVVLYRLSTGYRPFQGNSTATVCYKLLRQDPLPPSALNSELPPALDDFLNHAMAKDPDQRFQTGEEMALAIHSLRQSIEKQQDPLAPLRKLIDRTGVSHVPAPLPPTPAVFEVPLPELKTPLEPVTVAPQPKVAAAKQPARLPHKPSNSWMTPALVAAPVVAALAAVLLWEAHRSSVTANQEQSSVTQAIAAAKQPPGTNAEVSKEVPKEEQPSAAEQRTQSATPKAEKRVQAAALHSPKAERKNAHSSNAAKTAGSNGSAEDSGQPIVVHNMEMAKLDVVIEHGFEVATASVLIDQKPIFSQELHGESKRRGLLFRRTQGKQSGTINMLPGKHDIVVRVQSPEDGYDATQTLSEGFAQGSNRVLLIKCDKRKNKLDAVIH